MCGNWRSRTATSRQPHTRGRGQVGCGVIRRRIMVHAVRRRDARTSFFSPILFPCALRPPDLRSPSDPIPPWSTTLMQSEDMRRRRRRWGRHDPVVDHPEDASCKNKRTGSLGMSRDSVLYRSPAYIDTNLCPPQAVLCICHIYIYRLSLNLLLCLASTPSPLPLLSSLGFSLSHPFREPLYLPLVYPFATTPFLASSQVRRVPNTHTEARSLHSCLCCTTPDRHRRRHHHPSRPPRVLVVRVCGGDRA